MTAVKKLFSPIKWVFVDAGVDAVPGRSTYRENFQRPLFIIRP
jgi:hypothetical protein